MKNKYLSRLADLVVDIDEGKNITDKNIVSITDQGIRLIAHMKLLGLDVGALQEIFAGMQLAYSNHVVLVELLDMAHDEIARLLGRDAWRVYGWDDGGLFFRSDEANCKVAA